MFVTFFDTNERLYPFNAALLLHARSLCITFTFAVDSRKTETEWLRSPTRHRLWKFTSIFT